MLLVMSHIFIDGSGATAGSPSSAPSTVGQAKRGVGHSGLAGTIGLVLALAAPLAAQPLPDADTVVLLQFDEPGRAGGLPDWPGGSLAPDAGQRVEGRFGQGLDLADGRQIAVSAPMRVPRLPEGTIDFWIKPHWAGGDDGKHAFFRCAVGQRGYITINTLGKGRLGVALAGEDKEGNFVWRRADGNISAWKPGEWHHVAFAWGRGQLTAYIDGEPSPKRVADAATGDQPLGDMHLLGGDAVIDAFRIWRRMLSPEDVRHAIQQSLLAPPALLSRLPYQPAGAAEADRRTRLGGIKLPLVLGAEVWPAGLACRPGTKLTFNLAEPYEFLEATVGVDALSRPDATCAFKILGDGKVLSDTGPRGPDQEPLPLKVPVSGVKQLVLETLSGQPGRRSGWAVWANPVLSPKGRQAAALPPVRLEPADLAMYGRQQSADDFTFRPSVRSPCFVARKFWEDDLDQAQAPAPADIGAALETFAAPGEYEPVNCVVYAQADVEQLAVEAGDLRSGAGVIPRAAIEGRLVLRGLMRDLYTLTPDRSTVVSRFLLPYQPVDVPAGTLREYHITLHVPDDARPGRYEGRVRFRPANQPAIELPLAVEVLPGRLREPTRKAYGMYYRFPREGLSDETLARVKLELADIRAHGATSLKSDLGVRFEAVGDQAKPSCAGLEAGLQLLRKHGFRGALPVHSGCPEAARLADYNFSADEPDAAKRPEFFRLAKLGLEELLRLGKRYPEFEFLPTHMDEVLGRGRLEPYIRLTEAVRQIPSLRVYITMHNRADPKVEAMIRRLDPFVDVRCYNGHAMDDWIAAGHTFAELAEELKRSGDEAWVYYNIRGSFFKAEWTRLVNGFYMWISPIRAHHPWTYYSCNGNPLDETDGPRVRGPDFVYAVPDPADPTRLVSTRHWEAYREGVDDMRYLCTLEDLVAERRGSPEAAAAQKWLDELRAAVTPKAEDLKAIDKESPILVWLSQKWNGADYRRMRRQAAEHIARLSAGRR